MKYKNKRSPEHPLAFVHHAAVFVHAISGLVCFRIWCGYPRIASVCYEEELPLKGPLAQNNSKWRNLENLKER